MSKKNAVLLSLAALILGLAAQLRVGAALHTVVDAPLRADAGEYFRYAYNLRAHGVYSSAIAESGAAPAPDAARNPGYPLFLAALLDLPPTAASLLRVVAVQALLGTLVVAGVLVWSLRLVSWPLALLATFLTAISPHLVNAGVYVLTETLFSFAVVAAFLALPQRSSTRAGAMLAVGLLLGWSVLIRPTLAWFPWVLAVLLVLSATVRQAGVRAAALMLLGFFVVVAPWTVRNLAELGTTGDPRLQINMLHHGMYPDFMYENDPESFGYPYRYDPRAAEISASMGSVMHEIGRKFAERPAEQLRWYLLGKPVYLWGWDNSAQGQGDAFTYPVESTPYTDSPVFVATHAVSRALHWPAVLLAAVGCLLVWVPRFVQGWARETRIAARALSALLGYVTALHMVGAPFPRYGIPFRPEIYVAAVLSLELLWRRATDRAGTASGSAP